MAQDEPTGSPPGGAAPAGPPQLFINAQYVKDLSFENPRAPQSLIQQKAQPEVSLDVDVKARNLAPDLFEVALTISAEAKAEGETAFIVQLTYCGVVSAQNATPEILNAMIMIETPRLLFPFARNVIATATRDGGFPPLLINPIDFAALVRREQEKAGATTTA
ncbi:MAG TPA: protein-export chaperone SecB [Stellaceae bacterium]|jgi:preprotein translocase subunit SecB|nr:protein-export chaperone SecB [Stellaceae bacterium]